MRSEYDGLDGSRRYWVSLARPTVGPIDRADQGSTRGRLYSREIQCSIGAGDRPSPLS
jgi:hypothetical protein